MSTSPGGPPSNGDDSRPGPPPGYPAYGYGYPGYPMYPVVDHPKATTAMVLGLVGIIGGLTCYLPLALGPFAWAIGRRAVREIDAEPYRFGARGQAMAGYVLGIICTVLLVLGLFALAALLLLTVAPISGGGDPVRGIRA